jgi:hypothetical protein
MAAICASSCPLLAHRRLSYRIALLVDSRHGSLGELPIKPRKRSPIFTHKAYVMGVSQSRLALLFWKIG